MNSLRLTPQQAAERASVSRATIVRALQSHALHGIRGNDGRWNIDPEALDSWSAHRANTVHEQGMNSDQTAEIRRLSEQLDSARQEIADRDKRLARLEAEAAAQAARKADAAADRDAWREQAQRLAERGEPHPPAPTERRGLRLFSLFRR